jgi:hypothetical protein
MSVPSPFPVHGRLSNPAVIETFKTAVADARFPQSLGQSRTN